MNDDMKQKVLILAYNFPPSTRTSASRAAAWARYLTKFGYYPVIITRNWDVPMKKHDDEMIPTGTEIVHQQHEGYEVYYVPYYGSIRDKLWVKYADTWWFRVFSKGYTLCQIFLRNYSDAFIPYHNMYDCADTLLSQHPEIKKMVVTALPVYLFKFAYQLHKKHEIQWIADYRDDWTTSEFLQLNNVIDRRLYKIEQKKERQWVGTASFITAISDGYVQRISNLIGHSERGMTLTNGFFEEELAPFRNMLLYDDFTITYNGTLYRTQKLDMFIEAVRRLIDAYPNKKIRINFPGIGASPDVMHTVQTQLDTAGLMPYVWMSDRIPKAEVFEMQARSHVLLMVGHENISTSIGSKVYEYIGLQKPVLLCPSDNGTNYHTLKAAGNGLFATTSNEAFDILERLLLGGQPQLNMADVFHYSRESQTQKLAGLLDRL
jgi:glycosyltransferase involved in cell wall biosynthesis